MPPSPPAPVAHLASRAGLAHCGPGRLRRPGRSEPVCGPALASSRPSWHPSRPRWLGKARFAPHTRPGAL